MRIKQIDWVLVE